MTARDFRTELGLITANNTLVVNTATGQVGVNCVPSAASFQVAANDALIIPVGTTLQRPSAANGAVRLNSDTLSFEFAASGQWIPAGAAVSPQTLTFASPNTVWNVAAGSFGILTLTGNTIMQNPTSLSAGYFTLQIIQDGTGGRNITTWGNTFFFPAGVAPVLTSNANAVDLFTFISNGSVLMGTYINNLRSSS